MVRAATILAPRSSPSIRRRRRRRRPTDDDRSEEEDHQGASTHREEGEEEEREESGSDSNEHFDDQEERSAPSGLSGGGGGRANKHSHDSESWQHQPLRLPSFTSSEAVFDPALRALTTASYFRTLISSLRLRNTVLPEIGPLLAIIAVYAMFVVAMFKLTSWNIPVLDERVVSMLGGPIAMLLAFRTNRAFERYQAASRLWSNLSVQIRHLARLVWTGISCGTDAEDPDRAGTRRRREEKRQAMRILLAIPVATRNALRGVDASPAKTPFGQSDPLVPDDAESTGAKEPSSTHFRKRTGPSVYETINHPPSHPLDLLHRLRRYLRRRRHSPPLLVPPTASANFGRLSSSSSTSSAVPALDAEDYTAMTAALTSAVDSLSQFDQILCFPVPRAFDIHMKQILAVYFGILPLAVAKGMGWAAVPVCLIMAVAFFGTDAIGAELSEPFKSEQKGLPLDYFCDKLRDEIEHIMYDFGRR
ncbi:Bestrophin, RFP-TM, chloride channel-domain-containing protein [Zopfochytrium polystomum]|nr:Bestrophin, RFP-TM, chloride channel-domain-containing protein [Zopfochytrium polystomum]